MTIESFGEPEIKKEGDQEALVQELEGEDTPWGRLGLSEEEYNKLYDDSDDPDTWLYQRK